METLNLEERISITKLNFCTQKILRLRELKTNNNNKKNLNKNNGSILIIICMAMTFFAIIGLMAFKMSYQYNLAIKEQMFADKCSLSLTSEKAKIFKELQIPNRVIKMSHLAIIAARATMLTGVGIPQAKAAEEAAKEAIRLSVSSQDLLLKTAPLRIAAAIPLNCLTKGTYTKTLDEVYNFKNIERKINEAVPDVDGSLEWKQNCSARQEKFTYMTFRGVKASSTNSQNKSFNNERFGTYFIKNLKDYTDDCKKNS